jgi:hypothetical protein
MTIQAKHLLTFITTAMEALVEGVDAEGVRTVQSFEIRRSVATGNWHAYELVVGCDGWKQLNPGPGCRSAEAAMAVCEKASRVVAPR